MIEFPYTCQNGFILTKEMYDLFCETTKYNICPSSDWQINPEYVGLSFNPASLYFDEEMNNKLCKKS